MSIYEIMPPSGARWCIVTLAGACAWLAAQAGAAAAQPVPEVDRRETPASQPDVQTRDAPFRAVHVEPVPAEPPSDRIELRAEPIADGAVIAVVAGFAGVLDLVNSTGEIVPQQIPNGFKRSRLLGIDRVALDPGLYHEKAELFSSLGLIALASYAAIDPIWTGLRERHVQAGIVDALVYAESIAISWGLTNLVKVAVRRPRPQAYYDAERGADDPDYSNTDTESALSFFSGHASITASISSTATYLAFIRSPGTARPWITLAFGTAITTFVSIERVRARAHFPTDVIAGAVAGAGVGILVPHLHRTEPMEQRNMWIGFQPQPRGRGGSVTVGGMFSLL